MSGTRPLPIGTQMARFIKLKILLAMGPEKVKVPKEIINQLRKDIEIHRTLHHNETDFPFWKGHRLRNKEK
jgi:hypothetical protein